MIVLSCNNISKSFVVDKILDNISFSIREGEKVGVVGLNGSGKSTLFNILYGKIPKDTGEIYIRKGLKIGYLKQHTQINSEKTVFHVNSGNFPEFFKFFQKGIIIMQSGPFYIIYKLS